LILIEGFMAPARHVESAIPARPPLPIALPSETISVGLNAAILAVRGDEPVVALVPAARGEREGDGALPGGPFSPRQHKTLDAGLRFWVRQQTGVELSAARQIGALGDCRIAGDGSLTSDAAVVSIGYLAPVRPEQCSDHGGVAWRSWYAYFPWEDWRRGKPQCLTEAIEPRLEAWATRSAVNGEAGPSREALDRSHRLRIAFGREGAAWDEEKVLERYELLCEAGIAGEGEEDGEADGGDWSAWRRLPRLSHPLLGDHARVLASAIGELRRSVKCEPVIFELMPDVFTLFELQKTVEAILGPHLHKQNFRRLVEGGGLVEPTGEHRLHTGGRPARLYRFRRDVLLERLAPGVRIKAGRS
jgi:hypothetical protein